MFMKVFCVWTLGTDRRLRKHGDFMEIASFRKMVMENQKVNLDPIGFPKNQSVERTAKRFIFQGAPVILHLTYFDTSSMQNRLVLQVDVVYSVQWEAIEEIHKTLQGDAWWVWQVVASQYPLQGYWSNGEPIKLVF